MLDHRIQTFLTLYKEMNYRRTAELLRMTQPGVTQHIQYLEKHYGVKLFEYNGRLLTRTPEADILKRHIQRMLSEERSLNDAFRRTDGLFLRVGATKTIGEFVLAPTVRRFLQNPAHSLEMIVDNTRTLLEKLESCELDFALVEGVFDKTQYDSLLYKKERFVGICARNHPFAGKSVPMEDIFGETIVVREQGSGTRRLLEQALTDHGYSLNCFVRTLSVNHFSVISSIVSGGSAITFAYLPVARHSPDLATFHLQDIQITGEFNFVYIHPAVARQKIAALMGETVPPPISSSGRSDI